MDPLKKYKLEDHQIYLLLEGANGTVEASHIDFPKDGLQYGNHVYQFSLGPDIPLTDQRAVMALLESLAQDAGISPRRFNVVMGVMQHEHEDGNLYIGFAREEDAMHFSEYIRRGREHAYAGGRHINWKGITLIGAAALLAGAAHFLPSAKPQSDPKSPEPLKAPAGDLKPTPYQQFIAQQNAADTSVIDERFATFTLEQLKEEVTNNLQQAIRSLDYPSVNTVIPDKEEYKTERHDYLDAQGVLLQAAQQARRLSTMGQYERAAKVLFDAEQSVPPSVTEISVDGVHADAAVSLQIATLRAAEDACKEIAKREKSQGRNNGPGGL